MKIELETHHPAELRVVAEMLLRMADVRDSLGRERAVGAACFGGLAGFANSMVQPSVLQPGLPPEEVGEPVIDIPTPCFDKAEAAVKKTRTRKSKDAPVLPVEEIPDEVIPEAPDAEAVLEWGVSDDALDSLAEELSEAPVLPMDDADEERGEALVEAASSALDDVASDEPAEEEVQEEPARTLTHEDLRGAINDYMRIYGRDAGLEDLAIVLEKATGHRKVSLIPVTQEDLGAAYRALKEAAARNPFNRPVVG